MSSLLSFRRSAMAACTCLAIASFARADTSPSSTAAELHANVVSIEDNRSSAGFNSLCRLTLAFVGDEVADTRGVLEVRVTKARDEVDRDLTLPDTALPRLRALGVMMGRISAGRGQTEGVITLRNPSRRAATIKGIEGVVDLFRPTEANDGVVVIPGGLGHRDVVIESAALQKYGIELTCLSEEKAAEARPFLPSVVGTVVGNPTPEAERRRLEAVAAEVARRRALREAGARQLELLNSGTASAPAAPRVPAPISPASSGAKVSTVDQASGTTPPRSASTIQRSATLPPSEAKTVTAERPSAHVPARPLLPNEVAFQIKDPQHKLIELECRDADGHVLSGGALVGTGMWAVMRFESPPPTDAKLVVYIASSGAVESHPFKLEDIPLP